MRHSSEGMKTLRIYTDQLIGDKYFPPKTYSKIRLDLATEHQRLIGNEQKVLQILKTTHDSALSDDTQLRKSCKNIGIKVSRQLLS